MYGNVEWLSRLNETLLFIHPFIASVIPVFIVHPQEGGGDCVLCSTDPGHWTHCIGSVILAFGHSPDADGGWVSTGIL